jgi:hypothetical protein
VSASPANQMTVLANKLVNAIKWSTDMRFNLVWSYGIFLTEIPSRLGNNEALDYAVEAVLDAHSTACSLRKPSTANLINYSAALSKLRCCLDDSTKATSSETLAAVIILLICQVGHCILIARFILTLLKTILGISDLYSTGHGEGAALILKSRGKPLNPEDKFESTLLLSLRGMVVFECCFNRRIKFTRDEWDTLIMKDLDLSRPEGRMMRCAARAPEFIRRGKMVRSGQTTDLTLVSEMRENYEALKSVLEEFRIRLSESAFKREVRAVRSYFDLETQLYTAHLRLYGLTFTVGIILNLPISTLAVADLPTLQAECDQFVSGILALKQDIEYYKPIGSACLQLFMDLAWAGTSNMELRTEIEGIFEEMVNEFVTGSLPKPIREGLNEMEQHLRLHRVASYDN